MFFRRRDIARKFFAPRARASHRKRIAGPGPVACTTTPLVRPVRWIARLATAWAAVVALGAAHADQTPRPVAADARVRTVAYRADDVVSIEGRYGYLTMIELAADERIENVAIGDSLAWQVVPSRSAHMLFLKPVEANAATNLAVVTNRRTYAFALSARAPQRTRSGAPGADGLYRVIFSYPEEEAHRAALVAARARADIIARDRAASAIEAAQRSVRWTTAYRMRGDRDVRPKTAVDDGRFTYFQFARNAEIPAIFAIEEDGAETLVNYVVRGPYVVVERLAPAWRLRAGKEDARIDNRRWRHDPEAGSTVAPTPVIMRDTADASSPQPIVAPPIAGPPIAGPPMATPPARAVPAGRVADTPVRSPEPRAQPPHRRRAPPP
jgi:type IV secretion system protein VirB9